MLGSAGAGRTARKRAWEKGRRRHFTLGGTSRQVAPAAGNGYLPGGREHATAPSIDSQEGPDGPSATSGGQEVTGNEATV